jgi:hypothetical protein
MSGYYEPEDEPRGDSSSGKGLLIVLGVVVLLGIVCAGLVVVGLAAFITLGHNASGTFNYVGQKVSGSGGVPTTTIGEKVEQADVDRVVTQFLDDIRFQRIDAAYARTSPRFQGNVNRLAFGNVILGIPALGKLDGKEARSLKLTGPGRASCTVTPRGSRSVELLLVKREGNWEIDNLIPQ